MNYLLLVPGWGAYLAVHSLLATSQVKRFFTERLPAVAGIYRFLYSLISAIGMLALFFYMTVIESRYLFEINKGIQYVGMVLAVWGIIVITAAFRIISGLSFLGLKKQEPKRLVREGIHGSVRHPIYSGIILIFTGMFLYVPSDVVLVSILTIFAYLPVGIYLEDKKLMKEFGDAYRKYKEEVPALMPRFFRRGP